MEKKPTSEREKDIEALLHRIDERIKALGTTANKVSERIGHRDAIRNIRNKMSFPSSQRLKALAQELQCTTDYLTGHSDQVLDIDEHSMALCVSFLNVSGFVQATLWANSDDLSPEESYVVPWPREAKYPKLTALQVRGDSMNQEFDEGDTLIVCPAWDYPDPIERGQFVIVRRECATGMYETTVKGYEVDGGDVWLVPYSTNRAHIPFKLPKNGEEYREGDRQITSVDIIGVVVGVYPKTPPRRRP